MVGVRLGVSVTKTAECPYRFGMAKDGAASELYWLRLTLAFGALAHREIRPCPRFTDNRVQPISGKKYMLASLLTEGEKKCVLFLSCCSPLAAQPTLNLNRGVNRARLMLRRLTLNGLLGNASRTESGRRPKNFASA